MAKVAKKVVKKKAKTGMFKPISVGTASYVPKKTRKKAIKHIADHPAVREARRLKDEIHVGGVTVDLSKIPLHTSLSVDAEMDRISESARRDEQLRHDNVMTQAQDIIYGEREKTYGRPEVNLETIAQFWTVYLQRKHAVQGDGLVLTKADVCQMMVFMKSGRLLNEPDHHDSQVDQIGYIGLQERVRGR